MDERDIASGLGDWLIAGDYFLSQELAEKWKRGRIVGGEAEAPPPTLRPSDRLEPGDHFTDEEEVPRQARATKVKYKEREASYVIVSSPESIRRLHRAGKDGCWMDQREFDSKPPTGSYNRVCKLCWPPKESEAASESDEGSSAHTGDGEETADGSL